MRIKNKIKDNSEFLKRKRKQKKKLSEQKIKRIE